MKNYGDMQGEGLLVPSSNLYDFVEKLEKVYRDIVEAVVPFSRVMYRLVTELGKRFPDSMHCSQCHSRLLIINLFARLRLHHTLREGNRELVDVKGRRNRRVLKFSNQ